MSESIDKTGLWLFGGEHCGVCHAIRPQIERYLRDHWPDLSLHYVDCEKASEECAQNRVFSLPVVRLYLDGRLYIEEVQVFSLSRFFKELDYLCERFFHAKI